MLRETVLNRILELVEEQYVFPGQARSVVELMRQHISEYALAKTDRQFATMISRDLLEVTHDPHLFLDLRRKGSSWEEQPLVAETKFLEGGIAVITINRFPTTHSAKGEEVIRDIDHAFLMAARAPALILDVRGNEGGDASSVALATTYLLPPTPQRLALYRYRGTMAPGESWTWERLPSEINGPYRPLADKPVCVLVSRKTFSAAEEFAYNLQQLKRAIIVGEQTRGGAHPSKRHIIDGNFVLSLPFAETINPVSKTNWEGRGITPDIPCARKDALRTALEYLRSFIVTSPPPPFHSRLASHLRKGDRPS